MDAITGILTPDLLLAAVLLVGAGVVRGFTGFGAALLLAPVLALLFGVQSGVAIIVLLNVIVAIQLMPSARRASNFGTIGWLTAAACATSPLGAWMLGTLDPELMRRLISGLVLLFCIIIAVAGRDRLQVRGSTAADITAGGLGGFLNGLAGIGGPPITLYWIAQRNSAEALRANVILAFAVIHTVTIIVYTIQGLLGLDTILRTLLLTPPFMFGVWIGSRFFSKSSEEFFLKIVLVVLSVVAIATLML